MRARPGLSSAVRRSRLCRAQFPRDPRRQGAAGLAGAGDADPAQAAAQFRRRLVAGADRDRGPDRDRRGACRGQPRGP